MKFNGDPGEYELFRQKLSLDIQKSEAGHILDREFEVPINPMADRTRIQHHNLGWNIMHMDDLERCEKKVEKYNEKNNEILKRVTILNGVIGAGTTLYVMQTFQHITQRQDITGLEKVKALIYAMDQKYRVYNDSPAISITAELEAYGYCSNDADVLYLMESMTALKAKIMIMAGAGG